MAGARGRGNEGARQQSAGSRRHVRQFGSAAMYHCQMQHYCPTMCCQCSDNGSSAGRRTRRQQATAAVAGGRAAAAVQAAALICRRIGAAARDRGARAAGAARQRPER